MGPHHILHLGSPHQHRTVTRNSFRTQPRALNHFSAAPASADPTNNSQTPQLITTPARPLFQPSVAISPVSTTTPISQGHPRTLEFMSIENLKTFDPFAEADEDTGETKQSQNYIHIRIQQRNGRKTLTTVQGLPKKFDQKKILKVIKKKFGTSLPMR